MTYQILDDRPSVCEGCSKPDYPGKFGPSARQITWNNILRLWLCVECQHEWSNWMGTGYDTEAVKQSYKPGFLVSLEKERGTGK